MELRTLRSFLAVAREGNVTRAARSLHITQPALSRQLAELERELGCELLLRESRGVTLTDEGMLLRKRAEEIVLLADRTEQEIRSPEADIEGDVWVGGGETRAMVLIADVAQELSLRYPGLRLRLHSGNADDVIERVEKGLLDFGLIIGREPQAQYDSLQLPWQDRWGVLMRRDDPLAGCASLTTEDLRGRRLIVSSQGAEPAHGEGTGLRLLGREGFDVVATYTLAYNASLMVERGLGICVSFDQLIYAGEDSPFAFVPLTDLPTQGSRLIWKRYQPLSRACDTFLHALRSRCEQEQEVEAEGAVRAEDGSLEAEELL